MSSARKLALRFLLPGSAWGGKDRESYPLKSFTRTSTRPTNLSCHNQTERARARAVSEAPQRARGQPVSSDWTNGVDLDRSTRIVHSGNLDILSMSTNRNTKLLNHRER